MKTAVIYTRVSSEEQVSGTSLDTQLADCNAYAAAHGYTVAKVYTDAGLSAKTANRPALQQAIVYCLKQHVSAFVVWKLDRLSRNTTDGLIIRQKLRNGGTEVLSATESIAQDAAGDLISSIILSVAQYDNTLRATRCRRGMEETALKGGWVWKAPIGFDLVKRADGLPILNPNDTGRAIQKALRAYAAGTIDKRLYYATLESLGLTRTQAAKIPEKDIYAGIIRSTLTGGQPIQAAFDGLITEEERQAILRDRDRRINRRAIREDIRDILTCSICGKPLTAYTAKGHLYYKCPASHVNISAAIVDAQVQTHIDRLPFLTKLLDKVVEKLRARAKEANDHLRQKQAAAEARATAARRRLDALVDAHLDGTIDAPTYARKSAEYRATIAAAETAKTDTTAATNRMITTFEQTMTKLRDPSTMLAAIPSAKRSALLSLLFGRFDVTPAKSVSPSSNSVKPNLLNELTACNSDTYKTKKGPSQGPFSGEFLMVDQTDGESNCRGLIQVMERLGRLLGCVA